MELGLFKWPNDEPILRRTGLPRLTLLPWGGHICMFYETLEDLVETAADYFAAGLADNEFCIWATPDLLDRDQAVAALRRCCPQVDDYIAKGALELVPSSHWYLVDGKLDAARVVRVLGEKLERALAAGYLGLRGCGDALWLDPDNWPSFNEYESELGRAIAGMRMVVLCTYPLGVARAGDFLDVTRSHHVSLARRNGEWEFLETSELAATRQEIDRLADAMELTSRPFPGHDLLTPRERATLAEIVRGASNKEAARALGVSPRTIEFHRANIMRKLGARNVAELVGVVLTAS